MKSCCGLDSVWVDNVPGKEYWYCQECKKEVGDTNNLSFHWPENMTEQYKNAAVELNKRIELAVGLIGVKEARSLFKVGDKVCPKHSILKMSYTVVKVMEKYVKLSDFTPDMWYAYKEDIELVE